MHAHTHFSACKPKCIVISPIPFQCPLPKLKLKELN